MNGSKSVFLSKTFWVNAVALVAMVASQYGFDIPVEEQAVVVTFGLALVNVVLRAMTHKAVHVLPKKD